MTHTRKCAQCTKVKPVSEFNRSGKDFQRYCRPCHREYIRKWEAKNAGHRRDKKLHAKYGITAEIYQQMLDDQGGACWGCGRTECSTGRAFAVDHCHGSGRVRGLLCMRCNTILGKVDDDPVILQRLIKYLTERLDVDYRTDTTTE